MFIVILGVFIRSSFYYYQIILFPFQLEFREGMSLLITNAFLNGNNPYAEMNQPLFHNQYGFFYSVLLLPFSLYSGATLFIHRLINFICILISCAIIFDICYEDGKSFLYSLCASAILYQTYLEQSQSLAFPNTLGVCLMLLSVYIPWKSKFSIKSLIFCIILGIVAFFTKIYFIIGSIYVMVYLVIFRTRREAIIFSLSLSIATLISIIIVGKFFDYYFEDTILVSYYVGKVYSSWEHLAKQVLHFIILYIGLIIPATFIGIKKYRSRIHGISCQTEKIGLNLKKAKKLIADHSGRNSCIHVCFIMSCFLIIFFGRNTGAYFSYFAQLILPFMLIVLFNQFSKSCISRKLSLFLIMITLIRLSLAYPEYTDFYKLLNKDNYSTLEKIVRTHNVMYNSPIMVSIFLADGKNITDSGQAEYFKYAKTERSMNIYERYLNDISDKISNNYYEIVFEPSGLLSKDANNFKEQYPLNNYKLTGIIPIIMLQQKWDVKIWSRNDTGFRSASSQMRN